MDPSFQDKYQDLQEEMKSLAERNEGVYLSNPEPLGTVQYVLICMEPSLGRWAKTTEEARSKVEKGFRNFLSSIGDFILHFCVQQFLCDSTERYHITDLSKAAMLVNRAGSGRTQRYDEWYPLLLKEIDLCAAPGAGIVAVGEVVFRYLRNRNFPKPLTRVIHYSGQAALWRNAGILGREDEFRAFVDSVSLEDVLAVAEERLKAAKMLPDKTLSRLRRNQLTTSQKKLIFIYKTAFEAMRSRR